MKADNIIGAHASGERQVVGDRPEDFRRRKRDVKEKARPAVAAGVLQVLSQKKVMIILDPDKVIRRCLGGNYIGKLPVYGFVGGKIVAVEDRQIEPVVHDGPEHAIGVA